MNSPSPTDNAPKRLSLLQTSVTTKYNLNTSASPVTGPRPLRLVGGPHSPGPFTAPITSTQTFLPSPTGSASSSRRTPARRQSSISYAPRDRERDWNLRSPLIKRDNSLNGQVKSTSNENDDGKDEADSPASERPPLTLAEKHADLLHFIAQKESKCLELRSQLAAHEAELLSLKRKWERIVSRGVAGRVAVDTLHAPAPPAQGAVFEGIREGVQGVGRFIAGLSDRAPQAPSEPRQTGARQSQDRHSTSSVSTYATSGTRLSQSSLSSLDSHDESIPVSSSPRRSGEECQSPAIDDFGTIATISPSPASVDKHSVWTNVASTSSGAVFEGSAKMVRRKSRDYSALTSPLTTPDAASPISPQSPWSSKAHQKRTSISAQSFAAPSSIPGLGALSAARAVPPLSALVGTVGKKWGELQNGQKRASVLLSDVSNSFFAALSSPSSPPPSWAHPPSSTPTALAAPMSWIDNDDAGDAGAGSSLCGVTALAPDPPRLPSRPPTLPVKPALDPTYTSSKEAKKLEDDDDWNW